MLPIDNYIYASDLAEAYRVLHSTPGSVVLGGCGYIRLGARRIGTAIDLSKLGLEYIEKRNGNIEVGAMTTLRKFETDPIASTMAGGVLKAGVENIVGVQLRNSVTIGGTVAGRFPFSDPLTVLMALDVQIGLFKHGLVALGDYLEGRGYKDIVEKIVIPDDGRVAAFVSLRKAATDYAVLNTAVSRKGDSFRVAVGSRPGRAMRAEEAEQYLHTKGLSEASAAEAGRLAATSLPFGDNPRGSGEYRRALCPVLVKRALLEVLHAA